MELFKTIPEVETKTSKTVSDCSRKSSAGNPWAGQSSSILGRLFYHRTAKCKETTKKEQIQRIRSIRMDEWSEKALRKIHKKSLPRLFTGKSKATFWINRRDVCWGTDFISCQSVRSHIRYIHSKEIIPANVSSDRRYKGSKRLVFLLLTVLYW